MGMPKFLKSVFSVETFVGVVIIGAAIWSAMTLDVDDIASVAFSAKEKAVAVQEDIEHVEGRVAEIETQIGQAQPTVVVRQVNETPFRDDAALLERARRLRDAQRQADANR